MRSSPSAIGAPPPLAPPRGLPTPARGSGPRRRAAAGPPPSPFVTLAGGTQQLVDALVEALRAMPHVGIRTQCLVEGLELEGSRPRVRFCGGERMAPEATILATPARVTADLVESGAPDAAAHLRSIPLAPPRS
jgi:protoporphyrinogen oxidase